MNPHSSDTHVFMQENYSLINKSKANPLHFPRPTYDIVIQKDKHEVIVARIMQYRGDEEGCPEQLWCAYLPTKGDMIPLRFCITTRHHACIIAIAHQEVIECFCTKLKTLNETPNYIYLVEGDSTGTYDIVYRFVVVTPLSPEQARYIFPKNPIPEIVQGTPVPESKCGTMWNHSRGEWTNYTVNGHSLHRGVYGDGIWCHPHKTNVTLLGIAEKEEEPGIVCVEGRDG